MRKVFVMLFVVLANLAMSQVRFESGAAGLETFLNQLTVYPPFSKQNCIQGTVNVSFKLDKDGKISDSKVTSGVLGDLDGEAIRLIRLTGGKWIVPEDFDVRTNITITVNFVVPGYKCESKTTAEINAAKMAFEAEAGMMGAVTNFYKHKDQATPEQEAQIISIKNQLGIDDEYLNGRIKNALQKWKQGDKQGACEEFNFVKNTGSNLADDYLATYCK